MANDVPDDQDLDIAIVTKELFQSWMTIAANVRTKKKKLLLAACCALHLFATAVPLVAGVVGKQSA
eukprot:319095-Ditylum_brightwellii.AAC.1